ncbi:hypothetical protein PF008_g31434, partial [Phytophthora fragariae]
MVTSFSITLSVSSGAASVSSSRNDPNLSTTCRIRNSAMCSTSSYFTATATTYLVTYSTAAMTYRGPPSFVGRGPATSRAHLSPTSPPLILLSGGTTSRGRA